MIKLLEIENFLPFQARVVLPLADQGLVLLKGDVRVSASATSNGAGKTSIPSAISFLLFGVTLDGKRADAVCNRFTTGQTRVHGVIEDALGEWSVTRTRRPHGLKVTGIDGVLENEDAAVLQGKIEQRLGFGLHTFRNAVVFGQGAFDRYSSADQEEQLRMLDEIQGVDFSDALKRGKDWRAQISAQHSEATRAVVVAETNRVNYVEAVGAQRAARDMFAAEQAAKVAKLEDETPRWTKTLDDAIAARERHATDAARLAELEVAAAELESLTQVAAVSDAARAALLREESAARSREADLQDELDAIVSQPECPTCRQPVKGSKAALKRVRARYGELVAEAGRHVEHLLKLRDAADKKVTKDFAARDAAFARLNKATKDRPNGVKPEKFVSMLAGQCTDAVLAQRRRTLALAESALAGHVEQIAEARAWKWTGAAALAKVEADLAAATAESCRLAARALRLEDAHLLAEYCVEAAGDRGIRSRLVVGVAEFMNERIAHHLESLAAGEAAVTMAATTPTKKGTTRERISFNTVWSWGVSGGEGSGGQDRRKDLAVFAAAQDLAESRSARPFPIRVFDEPFDALDARGKELACEWVRKVAKAQGTVLLVTHSDEVAAFVEADRTWTIVLDKDGARVEVS